VIEKGKTTGFMSVCTKPKRNQMDEAAQLYRTLKGNNPDGVQHPARRRSTARHAQAGQPAAAISRWRSALAVCFGAMALMAMLMALHAMFGYSDRVLHVLGGLSFALALYGWYNLHQAIVAPIQASINAARILAGGDLTTRMAVDRHDELGQLQAFVRQLNLNLASIIGDIRINFALTRSTTTTVRAANVDLAARTEAQASNLEQTSASAWARSPAPSARPPTMSTPPATWPAKRPHWPNAPAWP
jgi:aerotaxis receptor